MSNSIIKTVSGVGSAVSSALIPILGETNAETLLFAAAVQPMLEPVFESIFLDIFQSRCSKREANRLGIAYKSLVDKVNQNVENGEILRSDDFFNENRISYKAEDIIEAVFRSVKDDVEIKKTHFYGNFMANLAFLPADIDYQYAMLLHKIVQRLSYRQLCILFFLNNQKKVDLTSWEQRYRNTKDIKGLDLFIEISELKQFNLLTRVAPFRSDLEIQNIELSYSGTILYKTLNLSEIDGGDIKELSLKINEML